MYCDICNKKTILPVRIGSSYICKSCFVKLNGPIWKYFPWDSYKSVEKLKNNTIEKAQLLDCPERVIESLSGYFDNVMATMNKCDGCSEIVQKLHSIGVSYLCKHCYSAIDNSAWNNDEYEDNEAVEVNRNKILKKAKKEGFPQKVINDINAHFDSKIQEGLYKSINGYLGQTLQVFDDHIILYTDKNFDYEDVSNMYFRYMNRIQNNLQDNKLHSEDVLGKLACGLLNKNFKITFVSFITSAIDSKLEDSSENGSLMFKVTKGDCKFDYDKFDTVDYYRAIDVGRDEFLGFLSFKNSDEERIFFFSCDCFEQLDDVYSYINEKMEKKDMQEKKNKGKASTHDFSSADEIKKFKELFDSGAITEEEYNEKKRQLLDL